MNRDSRNMTPEEYWSQVEAEAERLAKMDENDTSEPLSLHCHAICRTSGCPIEGVVNEVVLYVNGDFIYRVFCGGCSRYVSEIIPIFSDGPSEPLPMEKVWYDGRTP